MTNADGDDSVAQPLTTLFTGASVADAAAADSNPVYKHKKFDSAAPPMGRFGTATTVTAISTTATGTMTTAAAAASTITSTNTIASAVAASIAVDDESMLLAGTVAESTCVPVAPRRALPEDEETATVAATGTVRGGKVRFNGPVLVAATNTTNSSGGNNKQRDKLRSRTLPPIEPVSVERDGGCASIVEEAKVEVPARADTTATTTTTTTIRVELELDDNDEDEEDSAAPSDDAELADRAVHAASRVARTVSVDSGIGGIRRNNKRTVVHKGPSKRARVGPSASNSNSNSNSNTGSSSSGSVSSNVSSGTGTRGGGDDKRTHKAKRNLKRNGGGGAAGGGRAARSKSAKGGRSGSGGIDENTIFLNRHIVRRLANRLGLMRISSDVFPELIRIINFFLTEVKRRAVLVVENCKRKTVEVRDLKWALNSIGFKVLCDDHAYEPEEEPQSASASSDSGGRGRRRDQSSRIAMLANALSTRIRWSHYIPFLPFIRAWKSIPVMVDNCASAYHVPHKAQTLLLLREVTESYLSKLIEAAYIVTLSANRKTLMAKDFKSTIYIKMLDTVTIYHEMYDSLYALNE